MDTFSQDLVTVVTDSSEQNNNKKNESEITAQKGYVVFTQFIFEVLLFIGGAILRGCQYGS